MTHRFRQLLPHELSAYASECNRRIGVYFPEEYLHRSNVYGLFDDGGAMVGGALLCAEGPFRAVEGIPEPKRTEVTLALPESIFEGSGLWLDRSVNTPTACIYYYLSLWQAAIATKKTYGLFTYSTSVRTLGDFYGLGAPPVLYEGPVFCNGMTKPDDERVCIMSMRMGTLVFFLSPLIAPTWFARRMLRRGFAQKLRALVSAEALTAARRSP